MAPEQLDCELTPSRYMGMSSDDLPVIFETGYVEDPKTEQAQVLTAVDV